MAFSKVILNGVTLMDLTQDTVTAPTLKQGETAHGADGEQVVGTMSGGGGSSDGDVIFLDYDGTIVAAKTKTEINAMSSDSDLPANPTHTGLTAQGWNWTVTQLKAQLTAMPDQKVYVGQMYVTTSGDTEIDVVMPEGRLSPILTICVNGTITVDWGDNTTPDTVTGSSETTRKAAGPHTYTNAGNYTIKISVVSGSFSFYGASNYTLLRKNTSGNQNTVYSNCIKAIRIGLGITVFRSMAFYNCYSLSSITIPKSVTSIESDAFTNCYFLFSITIPNLVTIIDSETFSYCYALSNAIIPSSVTSIGNNAFDTCYSLSKITISKSITSIGKSAFNACYNLLNVTIPNTITAINDYTFATCVNISSITIPNSVTSIGNSSFSNCYSLSNIVIPSSVTSIGASAFYACRSMSKFTIPETVTNIGASAFSNCYGVKEYHFLSTSVPTAGTTIFINISSDCVIYVPYSSDHSILEAYKTANNWSTYATYMQEEPQS